MTFSFDLGGSLASLALQLVDIPSQSGNEAVVADAVEDALQSIGRLEVLRDGDTVMARTHMGREQRMILAGHLDTVPITGNVPGHVADGIVHGRGSADMKGGDAVFLALANSVPSPVDDVTWIFYDHEEVAASLSGLGRAAQNHPDWVKADYAILGEPTGSSIEAGCNGSLRVFVRTHGTAAHSARSWLGSNAIHAASPILDRLAAYGPATVDVEGLAFREGLNAVRIAGGTANNVIPDQCEVTVNYRYAPDKTVGQALSHVEAVFHGFDIEVDDAAPAAVPGLTHPAVAAFARHAASYGAGAPAPKEGWTDVARFAELGIPAFNFGPGDPGQAHTDGEQCPVSQLESAYATLYSWLTRP